MSSFDERRRARAAWPIRRVSLGKEPLHDSRIPESVDERIAMVAILTRAQYALAGIEQGLSLWQLPAVGPHRKCRVLTASAGQGRRPLIGDFGFALQTVREPTPSREPTELPLPTTSFPRMAHHPDRRWDADDLADEAREAFIRAEGRLQLKIEDAPIDYFHRSNLVEDANRLIETHSRGCPLRRQGS